MRKQLVLYVAAVFAAANAVVLLDHVGVGYALTAVGAGLVVFVAAWHAALSRALTSGAPPSIALARYPSVTIVRPVRGEDVGAAKNFRAALDTGYPGHVETLFVFDDEQDPGLAIAREVVLAHVAAGRAGDAQVIVAGPPPAGMTGKLHAMVVGEALAHGELVAFGDSDTRPDGNVLRGVVDALLSSPRAGSAFAPILVHQPPRAAGDVLYAIMQNALYAPLAAWSAGARRELPFIMGQLMVFRREALEAIGGVACAEGQLVDDMYIGKRVHEVGYTNVISRAPLHIATGGMTLRQFLPIYRRWMMFSRNGLPLSFTWRQWLQGVVFFVALAAMAGAVATSHPLAALPSLAAMMLQSASLMVLNTQNGAAPIPLRWSWVPAIFFLLSPLVLAQNLLRRRVEWRGRAYVVDRKAALAGPLAHA